MFEAMDAMECLQVEASAIQHRSPRLETVLAMLDGIELAGRDAYARFLSTELALARRYQSLMRAAGGLVPLGQFLAGARTEQMGVIVEKLGANEVWFEAMVVGQAGWVRSTRCSTPEDALDVLVRDGFVTLAPADAMTQHRHLLDAWRPSELERTAFVPLQQGGRPGYAFR